MIGAHKKAGNRKSYQQTAGRCRERNSLAEGTAGEKTEQETKQNGRKPCGDRNGLKCNANWRV